MVHVDNRKDLWFQMLTVSSIFLFKIDYFSIVEEIAHSISEKDLNKEYFATAYK